MNEITLAEFKQLDYNPNKIFNFKLINGQCKKCGLPFEYSKIKKFLRNRKNKILLKDVWDTCSRCWYIINTSESKEWIVKNSQAQLIAQNKPEQKIKNAIGVSQSWTTERRKQALFYSKKDGKMTKIPLHGSPSESVQQTGVIKSAGKGK